MAKGRFPSNFIDRVASATDIVAIIGRYTTLKPQGRRLVGLCPFHNEKTPSFSVDAEQGLYYCFGCHAGGTVFTFLMEKEGMTFADAVESLARDAGIELPATSGNYERAEGLEEAAEFTADFFARALNSKVGEQAREYLRGRGISEKTWKTFGIGWAPADQAILPNTIGKDRRDFKPFVKIGILGESRYGNKYFSTISDALVFPIHKASGRPVGFAHRRIRDDRADGPKYVNSADNDIYHKSSILYGLPQARAEIRRQKQSILVEGYFDVIALHEYGIMGAVACCGTALTSVQASILARYAPRAVILFDGDDAGLKATLRSIEILLSAGLEVHI
ncbi:MAG TPA: DNA primase, partial [candidate division Zixibacteria bacterium]|nr:DNA primase [candidate division Zixibacteria bacterium]